jgi:RimJ/RimL family protein N-acetyltransferase
MKLPETKRLLLRELNPGDTAFIIELLNSEGWIRFIGNRNMHTDEDALKYILNITANYKKYGFGFYVVERKEDAVPMGICGLVKREGLDDIDIGFAFLPEHAGQGYGYESAAAMLNHARSALRIPRIVAITSKDNYSSQKLLEKIGLSFERTIRIPGDEEDLNLYAIDLSIEK